jgi:hypothetical protein
MFGLEEMDLRLARDHQNGIFRQIRLDSTLTPADARLHIAAGIGMAVMLSVLLTGVRRWLHDSAVGHQRAADASAH